MTYRIELMPDLEEATFSGTVEIDVVVHGQTDTIVLNAAELDISSASVVPPAGDPSRAQVSIDAANERVELRLPAPLAKGDATVRLSFAGALDDKLRGFYRSTYADSEGTTHTIATTQMEATDARRAFPCWDEPDRKATYEITLLVDEGLAAYSNSPIVGEERVETDHGRKRRVRFGPTMKMSTYLVAFVIGALEATEPVDVRGTPVRVVHAPGKGHLTSYSLDVARHALEFFGDYFGIAYPGQKLDLVAIPDFAYGAMENMGCVTFREAALLVDPDAASRVELEQIADVVHHEIAHMWFGDLVTMGWWEGIWLNEAFATFMEMLATDHYRPSWQRWTSFGLERDVALATDGLHTTRPIEYPVHSPQDADGMFDELTYSKGAGVLRMLEQYLGAGSFQHGVRRYLETHAYGNTVTSDLWDALEDVSGEPVRALADTWILQGGHPLVTIGPTTAAQSPFSYLPEPRAGASAIGSSWIVPVLVRAVGSDAEGAELHRLLLSDEPVALPVASDGGNDGGSDGGNRVMLANAGGWGVYRTGYSSEHLESLARSLDSLSALERYDLFSDTWALVLAGRVDLADLFSLATDLGSEDEPAVFEVLRSALRLCDRIASASERPLVQAAARTLLGPRAAALGWEARHTEDARIPTLRALLIGELGTTGADAEVRAEAARRFDEAHGGGAKIDADLASAVLAIVADQCRQGDFDTVLDGYRHPSTPQDERRNLMALGKFADVASCERAFDLAINEVRRQDGPFLVAMLLANRVGGPRTWERVKSEWSVLIDRFPEVTHDRMVSSVRTLCADAELAADVERFLTEHPLEVGARSVDQTLEQLAINVRLAAHLRAGDHLAQVLGQISGGAGGGGGASRGGGG